MKLLITKLYRQRGNAKPVVFAFSLLLFSNSLFAAAKDSGPTSDAHLVVTVEAKKNKQPTPNLSQQDVQVYEGKDRSNVTGWLPLTGSHAGLQLLILLDDGSGFGVDTNLNEIKQ